jgi:hypothetical protein
VAISAEAVTPLYAKQFSGDETLSICEWLRENVKPGIWPLEDNLLTFSLINLY